eukprot:6204942-Pleurochrysis_carterae.AAC.1
MERGSECAGSRQYGARLRPSRYTLRAARERAACFKAFYQKENEAQNVMSTRNVFEPSEEQEGQNIALFVWSN